MPNSKKPASPKATAKTSSKPAAPPSQVPPVDDASAVKDPSTWATGGEPMTGAQESYLHTLARQAGKEDELPAEINKAEASMLIDELQHETGRGVSGGHGPTPAGAEEVVAEVAKAPAKGKKSAGRKA